MGPASATLLCRPLYRKPRATPPHLGLHDGSPLIAASRWGSLWGRTAPTLFTTLTRHRHLGQQSKHQHQYFEPLPPHVRSLLCVQETAFPSALPSWLLSGALY